MHCRLVRIFRPGSWNGDGRRRGKCCGGTRPSHLRTAHGLCLRALGGNGDGVIGALAGVGLRADGNEGRFLDLPGLRMLADIVEIRELTKIGIEVDHRLPDGRRAQGLRFAEC